MTTDKPTRSKSEQKRQQIINAASNLFTELGFDQTSMDAIAKTAGVSKQTVYSHFGNKDELFVAAITSKCAAHRMVGFVNDDLNDPQKTLTTIAFSFMTMLLSEGAVAMHRTCIAESESYPHVSRLFYRAGPEFTINEVSQCLAQFNAKGLLNIANTRHAAIQFLCMVQGEIRMQSEYNIEPRLSQSQVDDYIHDCVALFLRGYGVSNPAISRMTGI